MVRFCPHCWAEIPVASADCPQCGRPLDDSGEHYVDKLITALRHPEPMRAGMAIQILGKLEERRSIEPLIALVEQGGEAYVIRDAVELLGRFGDVRAVPALHRRLLDPKTLLVVRLAAVAALAAIGGEEAAEALLSALSDETPSVRDSAQRSLDLIR